MENYQQTEIISEAEDYKNKNEGGSYKDLVMKQLYRVVDHTSKEMREGFWIHSQSSPNQSPQKLRYCGDSRQELVRSMDCLHDLLLAKFDEDIKTKSTEIYESLTEIRTAAEESKDMNEYWTKKIKKYRELFKELCLFLNRINFLESGEVEEE